MNYLLKNIIHTILFSLITTLSINAQSENSSIYELQRLNH